MAGPNKHPYNKRDPKPDTAWIARKQRMDSPEIQDRTTRESKNISMKLLLMIF